MQNEENEAYYKYTGPQRLHKAIHTLSGILHGIVADTEVTPEELNILSGWVYDHTEFINRHPFNEIIPTLHAALADRCLTNEESVDLIWLCNRLAKDETYFDEVTSAMQRLHGMMAGISFDGQITESELRQLDDWMQEHEELKTCWPFDEVEALITSVLTDGKIDEAEHKELLAIFADFAETSGHRSRTLKIEPNKAVKGICAVDPQIEFCDKEFCFTGKSKKLSRPKLAEMVQEKGGTFRPNVVKSLHYLIVGADGNPCWAYACYGRKIEEAIELRKKGAQLVLVHENDFWDFV